MINKIEFIAIAGDSGGHVLPAIKYINELSKYKDPKSILFITNEIGSKFCDQIKSKETNIVIIKYKNKLAYVMKVIFNLTSIFLKNKKIKLIGFGGFMTTPVLFFAKFFNIFFLKKNNIFIHEQNYVLGLANKINLKIVDKIFTSFPSKILIKKEIYVGNFFYDLDKKLEELHSDFINILLLGGSGGSLELNDILLNQLLHLDQNHVSNVKIAIQVPNNNLERYTKKYQKYLSQITLFSFNDKLNYKDYDLIISRAGSGSLNDILYFTNSVFFVPHLHSRDGHQLLNLNFFKKYINIVENLSLPKYKKAINYNYINSLINPYSINKIICYITR